jgi:hypothetical protein
MPSNDVDPFGLPPEDATSDEYAAWVRARKQLGETRLAEHRAARRPISVRDADLGPYPKHGTQEGKEAWALAYDALHNDPASTGWEGEDTSEPLLEFSVDKRTGELVRLRFIPREAPPKGALYVAPTPRESRGGRSNTRTGPRKTRAPDDSESSPKPVARPPLTAAVRVWLKAEIDRRSRARLASERERIREEALREGWGLEP